MTNDELVRPFVRLGFDDVAAYQAAGNITFCTTDPDRAITERVLPALADAYGFDPVIFVRRLDAVRSLVDARPFTDQQLARTDGRVQVSFLQEVPSEEKVAEVFAVVPPDDLIAFVGRQWFWLPRAGISESRLPVGSVESVLGPTTIRTLGTISRMLDRFAG